MSRRALAEREHQRRRARRMRWGRLSAIAVAAVLMTSAILLTVADRVYHPASFQIEQVRFEGPFQRIDPEQLKERVLTVLENNFFAVDLELLRSEVEALAWVHRADVRRVWPRVLSITVTEQRPVARWGQEEWLNSEGEVVRLPDFEANPGTALLDGPPRTSQRVLQQYQSWHSILQASGMRIAALQLDPRFSWVMEVVPEGSVQPGNRVTIALGKRALDERLQRFLKFYPGLSESEAQRLLGVDVRYPNGLAARFAPEPKTEDPA